MRKSSTASVLLTIVAVVLLAGCTSGLPIVDQERLDLELPDISTHDGPVHSWYRSRSRLMTYWGEQQISLDVKARLPDDWKQPGDGAWHVETNNAEGKPLPFIGVVRTYTNENGDMQAVFVPALDLDKAPDGLYVIVQPGIETQDGSVTSIRPTALIYEIRDHTFRPFRVKIPLFPAQESILTPNPEALPEIPAGTPIRID